LVRKQTNEPTTTTTTTTTIRIRIRIIIRIILLKQTMVRVERIIIDCDPGIDDAMAILLALASPELKVEGNELKCFSSLSLSLCCLNIDKTNKSFNHSPVYSSTYDCAWKS
jgi:hypothetical protein